MKARTLPLVFALLVHAAPLSVGAQSDDTSATLFEKLTLLGSAAIVEALNSLDGLTPRAQPEAGVTYAHKLARSEAPMDWSRPAEELDRQIRAFDPFPGAETTHNAAPLKIWGATIIAKASGIPGTILDISATGLVVACGTGALRLISVQKPGGRRLPAAEWARAANLAVGQVLG